MQFDNDYGQLPEEKKKKNRITILDVILIMLLLIVFALIVVVGWFWVFYTPDPEASNPFEPIDPFDPFIEGPGEFENVVIGTDEEGEPITVTVPVDPPTVSTPDKKQEKGIYNFLLVGCDRVSRSTDIIMLISYDVDDNKISVVQIPRDTYVDIDGVNSSKINSVYSAYYNRAKKADVDDPEMTALSSLASMIQVNFGVRINYAAFIGLDGFVKIIDAIGGVYVDVPENMVYSDPAQDLYINLKKGPQWLDGDKAMQFVRFRKGYVQQDIGRQDALKIFMSALMLQVKNNFSVSMVANIAVEIIENMKTTIGIADFIYFGKSSLSADLSNVYMVTLPGKAVTVNGASVYVLYRADTAAVINEYLNVFGEEFTADDFDPYGIMTSEDSETVSEIYNMPEGTADYIVYNADDVNENSIKIP